MRIRERYRAGETPEQVTAWIQEHGRSEFDSAGGEEGHRLLPVLGF